MVKRIDSRKRALAAGTLTYLSTKPCPRGHSTERYTSSGGCVQCGNARPKTDKDRESTKAWYEANKERKLEKNRLLYQAKKEIIKRQKRAWNAANRGRLIKYCHDRRARKRNTTGTHTEQDRIEIWMHQKKRCALCRGKLRFEDAAADHITPLSKGGTNDRRNIQMAHGKCNSKKYNMDPIVFARRIGLLL